MQLKITAAIISEHFYNITKEDKRILRISKCIFLHPKVNSEHFGSRRIQ